MNQKTAIKLYDMELSGNCWLASESPTIADIACYPYVALAAEGGIDLDGYPTIRAWLKRLAGLPGYMAMPGIEAAY